MELDPRRVLRHDLRGKWNALRLCMTALQLSDTDAEKIEMLDLITNSADELDGVVQQIMLLPELPQG
jgi:hypothetical protein